MAVQRVIQVAILLLGMSSCASTERTESLADQIHLSITPYPYHSDRYGRDSAAEIGRFDVPAIRHASGGTSKSMAVGYLRYLAADDAPDRAFVFISDDRPVSSLRQDLFFALHEFGDVIVFSHRGFGFSPIPVQCQQRLVYPMAEKLDAGLLSEATRHYAEQCLNNLESDGYPRGFLSIDEVASDLNDLKNALNVNSIYLVAENAQANAAIIALKNHPGSFDGAVLINATLPEVSGRKKIEIELAKIGNIQDKTSHAMADSLTTLFDRLNEAAVWTITSSAAGRPLLVTVGALDLAFIIKHSLSNDGTSIGLLANAVDDALSTDYAALADLLLETRGQLGDPGARALLAAVNSSGNEQHRPLPTIDYALGWPEIAFGSIESDGGSVEPILSASARVMTIDSVDDAELEKNAGQNIHNTSDRSTHILVRGGGNHLLDTEPKVIEEVIRFLKGDSINERIISVQ